jgi:hypothetical protein
MATVVHAGTGEVTKSFAHATKHHEVVVDICPPRHGNRMGVVERTMHGSAQRSWGTLTEDVLALHVGDLDDQRQILAASEIIRPWCTLLRSTTDSLARSQQQAGVATCLQHPAGTMTSCWGPLGGPTGTGGCRLEGIDGCVLAKGVSHGLPRSHHSGVVTSISSIS